MNVSTLPTAAQSYIATRKAGRDWHVQIVTPCGTRSLKTTVDICATPEQASERGAAVAALMQRPFKARGVAQ